MMNMGGGHYFVLLSQYNRWMNESLYRAAQTLTGEQLAADRGAFFGSVLGIINHIMVADILWLKRFVQHPSNFPALEPVLVLPQPKALDELLHLELDNWWRARMELDDIIIRWCGELTLEDLKHPLSYTNRKGDPYRKEFGTLVMHMFNHQTHHRGQASTLLHQMGVDIGPTDLVTITPDAEEDHHEENHHV